MSNPLRIAIVDPNDATRENLKNVLLGLDSVWLEAECSRYEFFVDVVHQTNADIGFIALDAKPDRAIALIGETLAKSPQCTLLVSSSSTDGRLILESMRAGAKEFVTQPIRTEDVATALQRVRRQNAGPAVGGRKQECQILSVAGATGGVGASSVAVNLAVALAQDPENSVVLIDLDLALGDADVFLDTIPEYTLADVAQNIERLDLTLLKKSLTKHSSGLHLLPRPVQLEDCLLVTPPKLERVIGLLRSAFSHLIVDCSKGFTPLDIVALRAASDVLMVTQLDLPCLRNVVRLLMAFDDDSAIRDKVKIIVNRVGQDTGQISLKKACDTLGKELYWQIPNDYRVMVEVRNNGVPLLEHAPRAGITQSIAQLADSLCGNLDEDDESTGREGGKGRRWLNIWPARKTLH